MTQRFFAVALALSATLALASGHGEPVDPNAPVDKKKETAEFIFHHVADDTEFEMEIPFPPYHLPAIHIADAFSFLKIERVPGACDAHIPAGFEGECPPVSASTGVALYQGDGRPFEQIYAEADAALYRAKSAGKDRYQIGAAP